jgi:hypothetical protein
VQPAQPVIPNAADDPFAAMNAMAQIGTVQRAPEIVIVNDGRPVESVGAATRTATILKIAIPGVVALLIGLGIGRVSKDANVYNDGLRGAAELLGDDKAPAPSTVRQLKKALADLDEQLTKMQKNGFHTDHASSVELDKLSKQLDVKTAVYPLVRNITSEGGGDLAGQVMTFYANVNEVKALIDAHLHTSKLDENEANAAKNAAEAKLDPALNTELAGRLRYAIVVSAATDSDKNASFGAKLVEIGAPYCGDKMSSTGKCEEPTKSIAYRTDPNSSQWTRGERADPQGDAVPTKEILPLVDTPVLDTLVRGQEVGPSSFVYAKRLGLLYEMVHGNAQKNTKSMVEEGNRVETNLEVFAKKGSRFTFFL